MRLALALLAAVVLAALAVTGTLLLASQDSGNEVAAVEAEANGAAAAGSPPRADLRLPPRPGDALGRGPVLPWEDQALEEVELVEEFPVEAGEEPPPLAGELVDDEVLEAWYANGQAEFRGHQTLGPDGFWVREGLWEAWHENGQPHELGSYANDEEVGMWQWWHDNGTRMATGEFDDGQRTGSWSYWYENGNLQMAATYANGKANGSWTSYHENGSIAAQGAFLDGELSGPWTVWTEDGEIDPDGTGTYVDGEKVD